VSTLVESAEFRGAVIALIAVITSSLLTLFGNFKLQEHRHRLDQRADDRVALEKLQGAVLDLAICEAAVLAAWEKGELAADGASSRVAIDLRRTLGTVQTLCSSVVDDDVREVCRAYTDTWLEIEREIYANEYDHETWRTHVWRLQKLLNALMERSGEAIRTSR
jgi:hypothetical protein